MACTLDTVLLEAATRALTAAPKATCLLPGGWFCLTSSEWAAWIQALGSILAIVLSLRVAQHQTASQHRNALLAMEAQHALERAAGLQALKTIAAGGEELATHAAEVISASHKFEIESRLVNYRLAEMEAHLNAASSMPPSEIPAGSVVHGLALSLLMRTLIYVTRRFADAPASEREAVRSATVESLRKQAVELRSLRKNIEDGTFELPERAHRAEA